MVVETNAPRGKHPSGGVDLAGIGSGEWFKTEQRAKCADSLEVHVYGEADGEQRGDNSEGHKQQAPHFGANLMATNSSRDATTANPATHHQLVIETSSMVKRNLSHGLLAWPSAASSGTWVIIIQE